MPQPQEREMLAANSTKRVEVEKESVTAVLLETNENLREIQRYCEELDGRVLGDIPKAQAVDKVTPPSTGMVVLAFEARSQARAIMEFLRELKERL